MARQLTDKERKAVKIVDDLWIKLNNYIGPNDVFTLQESITPWTYDSLIFNTTPPSLEQLIKQLEEFDVLGNFLIRVAQQARSSLQDIIYPKE